MTSISRSRAYRSLWGATVGAAFGDGLSMTALPLLIASQTRDPFVVSLLQVATGLPWLLFGLVAGTLVDRWERRTVMWRTSLGRVFVALALGLSVILGHESVTVILIAAFLFASGTTLIRSAGPALLRTLVDRDRLVQANGRLQAGTTVAGSFFGPAVGGLLYSISAAAPALVQTVALIASVAFIARIPEQGVVAAKNGTRRSIWRETAEGIRWLASHQILRPIAASTCLLSASTGILLAVLVVHVLQVLKLTGAGYGLLVSVYAGGSVVGSLLTGRLRRRLGTNGSLRTSAVLGAASIGAFAAAPNPVLAGAALFFLGVATMLWNILAVTVRQELTPDRLLGRVTSAFTVLGLGAAPIAALVGGFIASVSTTSVAIGTAAVLCATACFAVARLPNIDHAAASD